MNYKEILENKTILNTQVELYLDKLISGDMTITHIHNKRYYYRKKGDIKKVLELTVAFEIYQGCC